MNREQRRHLSSTPSPGSVPVTVSREVPVTILAGADGSRQVVNHDTDEPCYACPCCALWAGTVGKLRLAMLEHENDEHALLGAAKPDWQRCLVCQLLAGVVDQ